MKIETFLAAGLAALTLAAGCSNPAANPAAGPTPTSAPATAPSAGTNPDGGPAAGNPLGSFAEPALAAPADISSPDQVLGTGTPASVTSEAFVAAVAKGGKILFNAGSKPFVLVLTQTAKVFNNMPDVVIDGGGIVTLSGGNTNRILYMSTRDSAQVWTTSHAQNQEHPILTVQNLTFVDGYAPEPDGSTVCGGGAIYDYGGQLRVVKSRFFHNGTVSTGPDVGGGAVRAFAQYNGLPVIVADSTFGGQTGYGNYGSNGGALSGIGTAWAIYNSIFDGNAAQGNGGNPANSGTPGGGSGGAIYNDGNNLNLALYGSVVENNKVNAFGAAIFFVADNGVGTVHFENCVFQNNTGGSWYVKPGISLSAGTVQDYPGTVWK